MWAAEVLILFIDSILEHWHDGDKPHQKNATRSCLKKDVVYILVPFLWSDGLETNYHKDSLHIRSWILYPYSEIAVISSAVWPDRIQLASE